MNDFQVVLVTCPNQQEAESIATALVKEQLAACVNIIPGLKSIYRWQGKVESSEEALLVIKSKTEFFKHLSARVKEKHSYDCPEIIALPITEGHPDYLKWLSENILSPKT